MAAAVSTRSRLVLVFDPYAPGTGWGLSGWRGAYVTNDWPRFVAMFWSNKSAAVFIDEAAIVFHRDPVELETMLTNGRHIDWNRGGGGHTVTMIAQRFVGFSKTSREQASAGFFFKLKSQSDADTLADEWGVEDLRQAPRLPPLHYFAVDSLGTCKRGFLTF